MFNGFPRELADFWFRLRLANAEGDLAEAKTAYRTYITEPLAALHEALTPAVEELGGLETARRRCVSPMYNDMRFGPTAPLREYCYLRFRRGFRAENTPGLYFDMGAEGYGVGIQLYQYDQAGAEALRQALAARAGELDAVFAAAYAAGFAPAGRAYKRDRFPALPDCPTKAMCALYAFRLERSRPLGETVYTRALADELAAAFRALAPVLDAVWGAWYDKGEVDF